MRFCFHTQRFNFMTPIESLNYKEQGKSPGLDSFYSLPFPIFISGY